MHNQSRPVTFMLAASLMAAIVAVRLIITVCLAVLGIIALMVLPGCATDGGLSLSNPATYSYRHVTPGSGETCEVSARSDRDLPMGIAIDIGSGCEVSLRAGRIDSENLSDVIQSVPVGGIGGITGR